MDIGQKKRMLNPLLVVGVHTKDIVYDRYPRMPDTSWAERAYFSGALDPSLGQAFSFPSLLQLLRIEVPLWRDLTTAKHPNADLPAEEDSDSAATGSAERSPKLALPVPVGLAEPPEVGTEEATEDEDMMAEPTYTFAKGYGRFGIGYTRLATALGNFEQGSIEAESIWESGGRGVWSPPSTEGIRWSPVAWPDAPPAEKALPKPPEGGDASPAQLTGGG